jgi:di/tricarboxylate transporter
MTRYSFGTMMAGGILMAAIMVLMLHPVPDAQAMPLALCMVTLGLWATGVLPEYLSTLLFITVAMIFAVAPASVVFAGFQSPATWLILGGLVMGVAVRNTGLGDRLALSMTHRLGTSYWGIIAGIAAVGTILGFCIPSSMGRAVLLMPVVLSLADGYGFVPGSKGRTGLILAAAFGSNVATFSILPANVPNLVLAGAAESLYQFSFTYAHYLVLHFPVLGALKLGLVIGMIVWGWPDQPQITTPEKPAPMSRQEQGLSVWLAVALGFWATDAIHHISPAWISMAAGVGLLMPKIGLVSTRDFNQQINFGSLFYVGGVISVGALLDKSGLGASMGQLILSHIPLQLGHPFGNFIGLGLLGTLTSMIATVTATPAILTPLAPYLVEATGFSLDSILNVQVLGFSNPLMTYESPPLVVAMALGGIGIGAAQRLCLWLALVTMVVLWPIDYLWWQYLGQF